MQRARQLCPAGCIHITLIYPLPSLKMKLLMRIKLTCYATPLNMKSTFRIMFPKTLSVFLRVRSIEVSSLNSKLDKIKSNQAKVIS